MLIYVERGAARPEQKQCMHQRSMLSPSRARTKNAQRPPAAACDCPSGKSRGILPAPRSGETYVFGRNSEGSYGIRRVLFGWPCLFGEAEGAAINVTVLAGGEVAIAVNGGEAKPTGVTFANGVRPFAQLGRQGDAVALLANL